MFFTVRYCHYNYSLVFSYLITGGLIKIEWNWTVSEQFRSNFRAVSAIHCRNFGFLGQKLLNGTGIWFSDRIEYEMNRMEAEMIEGKGEGLFGISQCHGTPFESIINVNTTHLVQFGRQVQLTADNYH